MFLKVYEGGGEFVSRSSPARPKIATCHGPVVGRRVGELNVFKGVPYAKPPVGELRFRRPTPPVDWSDPLDAGEFGPSALQPEEPRLGSMGPMSEDCLTLNVWAPHELGTRPVLFWIYGGANVFGGSSQTVYDGGKYAAQGLVFVSANYRLGAFGFLELGPELPEFAGSSLNGLRDLIAALHWVQANIAAFGGDPDNVTVMGESAGGKNICALATSPLARGLFRRVAVQSGGGHTVFKSYAEVAPVTRAFFDQCGLKCKDAARLLAMPADVLTAAEGALLTAWPKGFPFRPTLDGEVLLRRPIDAATVGATAHLAMIVGTCRDEAAMFMPAARGGMDPFKGRQIANIDLQAMQELEPRYAELFPALTVTERRIRQLTAEEYWIPSLRYVEAHVRAGGTAWMYRFDQAVDSGPLRGFAHHGCDVPFIFDAPWPELGLRIPPDGKDLARRTFGLWTQWAGEGIAAFEGQPFWPTYDLDERATLLIDRTSTLVNDPNGKERALWHGIL